jgi:hypothetical protein
MYVSLGFTPAAYILMSTCPLRGAASAGTMVDFMTSGGPNEAATIALCDMPRNDRPLRLADTAPDT